MLHSLWNSNSHGGKKKLEKLHFNHLAVANDLYLVSLLYFIIMCD